jgi:hypothetical protein
MLEEELVMAMPRRELYKVSGFTRTVDFALLESLDQEHWFAVPATLRGNPDAKEVRLGLLVGRGADAHEQMLVEERGVLLHAAPIPPECAQFGTGLRALRELARAAAKQLVDGDVPVVELLGYLNEDSLAECRDAFILIYRVRLPAERPAPTGMAWIGLGRLHDVALDPVSSLVAPVLDGRSQRDIQKRPAPGGMYQR